MLKYIKLFLSLLLSSLFAILCIIYLQLKGQQQYFLYSEIVFLILGVTLHIIAQIQTNQNLIKTDHYPKFFIILLLVLFCSLLNLDSNQLSENLISLIIGGMLNQTKLRQANYQDYIKVKKLKTILQSISLFFIFVLAVITKKQSQQNIQLLSIALVCLILFLVIQLQRKKNNQTPQEKMMSLTQNQTIQQINSQNNQWENLLEKQIVVLSLHKSDIIIDKISQYLDQHLKEKHLQIDDFLNNTQIIEISFQNENILFNKMIKIKDSLYCYIKDILNKEKSTVLSKNWKLQNQFQDDLHSKLMSPNESRSQLSIIYKNDSNSVKQCTLDVGNNAIDQSTIEKEFFSRSTKDFNLLFNQQCKSSNTKIVKFLGILKTDQLNYYKITFTNQNQSLIIEVEEESINQLKQKLIDIQSSLKLAIVNVQFQRIELILQDLKLNINQVIKFNLNEKLLGQILSQINEINICNTNFQYFLTNDVQQNDQSQIDLNVFLNSIKKKISQNLLRVGKNITINIIDELLLNKIVITNFQYLRLVIVNLLCNSIKECLKTDTSHSITITLSQINKEEIQFEIIDDAGGFSQKLNDSRILEGKLGIYVVQRLLPFLSQYPLLQFRTIDCDTRKGNLVSFQISKNINSLGKNKTLFSQQILESNAYNIAEIQQSL